MNKRIYTLFLSLIFFSSTSLYFETEVNKKDSISKKISKSWNKLSSLKKVALVSVVPVALALSYALKKFLVQVPAVSAPAVSVPEKIVTNHKKSGVRVVQRYNGESCAFANTDKLSESSDSRVSGYFLLANYNGSLGICKSNSGEASRFDLSFLNHIHHDCKAFYLKSIKDLIVYANRQKGKGDWNNERDRIDFIQRLKYQHNCIKVNNTLKGYVFNLEQQQSSGYPPAQQTPYGSPGALDS